jgi:hypothetical protein
MANRPSASYEEVPTAKLEISEKRFAVREPSAGRSGASR